MQINMLFTKKPDVAKKREKKYQTNNESNIYASGKSEFTSFTYQDFRKVDIICIVFPKECLEVNVTKEL